MFIKNAKVGAQLNYFDISSFSDKKGQVKWVAWFYMRVEDAVKELGDE